MRRNRNKLILFTVPWSLHCQKAEDILKKACLEYERIVPWSPTLMTAAYREWGIHRLPALKVGDRMYEGLQAIERVLGPFIEIREEK